MNNSYIVLLGILSVAVVGAPTAYTVAGSAGSYGFTNGVGGAARFNSPVEMSGQGDPQGNINIGDRSNQAIRRFDVSTAAVTTRASGGNVGSVCGISNVDENGNLWYGDQSSNKIWKLTAANTVALIGTYTWRTYGIWYNPVDSYLYVTAIDVCIVYKVHPTTGAASIYAGSTCGYNSDGLYRTAARYNALLSAAGTNSGDFYFCQYTSHSVHKISYSTGISSLVAGLTGSPAYADGPIASSRLNYPYGVDVACDGTYAYISDRANSRIRRVSGGYVTTIVGTGAASTTNGPALSATTNFPWGISAHIPGKVYWIEYQGHTLRMVDEQPHTVSCSYSNYCCQPFYDHCADIHASCTAMNLTPLQNACNANSQLCGVYNAAVATKASCNRLASDCDALINAC